ncbi:MAG: TolC family protein [Nitrospirae bacterium]|nr:TolC family protein [Nitrospirota bacterium]
MKMVFITLCVILASHTAFAADDAKSFTLKEVIEFGLKNNPNIIQASRNIEIETYGIDKAKGEKMPRLDFNSGVARSRYASPITPISGSPLSGSAFPEFDNNIYDYGISLAVPLYRGGRLDRGVRIAELKKYLSEDILVMSRQELAHNLTSIYFKILQFEKLLEASEASEKQIEGHRKNVELFLKAGAAARVELLKTETELAHASQNTLIIKNNIESAYYLLKTFMGIDDTNMRISVVHGHYFDDNYTSVEEAYRKALSRRPDYKAVLKRQKIAAERIKLTEGKRYPSVNLTGEYTDRSGDDFEFRENWNLAIRLSVPIFDGGIISAEVNKDKKEAEKVREEERSSRQEIMREINDSYLNMENAVKRIDVGVVAIESAKENLRIERLKYETGSGTNTDVLDAQTLLLRAEADYYQAVYDKNIAAASLRKAVGEDIYQLGETE